MRVGFTYFIKTTVKTPKENDVIISSEPALRFKETDVVDKRYLSL